MYSINQTTIIHVARLDERQLGSLLLLLLKLEASSNNIPDPEISLPENEKSKDGGIDGHIKWVNGPNATTFLKKNWTGFQNKATELSPAECKAEMLLPEVTGQPRKLKPEIEKLVDADGSYVLFIKQPLNSSLIAARITKMREALKEAGKSNYATMDIQVYDGNAIKEWTNKYASAVDMLLGFSGVTKPSGFKSWEAVARDKKTYLHSYQTDPTLSGHIKILRDGLDTTQVIRIIGHSGIGKTRMVLEAFRNVDKQTELLNAQFVYCDVAVENQYGILHGYIQSHRSHQSGIIVVDNCDQDRHIALAELINAEGELKLVTIGYDDSNAVTDSKIRLDRREQKQLVREIVNQELGGNYLPQDIDYVATLCEGYPWMAVRYCDIIKKNGITEFDKFFEEGAIEKLIFGLKKPDKAAYNLLRACAVFSAFGFTDDSFATVINETHRKSLQAQMEFIRTKVYDDVVSSTQFRETLQTFKNEDIIEQRGMYYVVKPTVLAIQLAAQWLTVTDFSKIREIIEELKTVNLEKRFLERLTNLDQLDKAKDIVEELWGISSPFGSAEVLNTEWGSLLFRYVVEVNPESTLQSLLHAFGNWSKAELFNIVDARRNIVWALEKLIFRNETFDEAAKFLFKLAVSENENWANNATGQITQVFQRFLGGTEADYNQRLSVLRWAIETEDDDFIKLAISCMAHTFIPQGQHHRSGGAENQGSGNRLVDYTPQTWEDIFGYWETIISILIPIINSNSKQAEHALKVLSRAIRTLSSEHAPDMIIAALKKVSNRSGQAWLDVRSELKKSLRYEQSALINHIDQINEILSEFQPKSLAEAFLAIVTLPDWTYEPPSHRDGQSIYKQQLDAEEFARKLITDQTDWHDHIPSLLSGEQRQGFSFGHIIGQLDPNAEQIVKQSLSAFKKIEKSTQNPGFLLGVVSGIDRPDFYFHLFQDLIESREQSWLSLHLTRHFEFPIEQLIQLFRLVDEYGHPITLMDYFRYGKPLQYLRESDVYTFIDKIASYGSDGKTTAFSILFMQCFQNEDNWARYHTKLRELMISTNLLLSRLNNFESFYWGETAVKLLKNTKDKELAKSVSNHLAEFSDHRNFSYAYDNDAIGVFEILFDQYFKETWPAISDALVSDYLTLQHLKSMIGTKNGNNGHEGVLFKFPENFQTMIDWGGQNERGRIMLANIIPFAHGVEVEDAETGETLREISIHPFAKLFIDKFGESEKMLDELSANLGTFGTVGGSEWYFKMLLELTSQLSSHPNATVKNWAKRAVKYYKKCLISEDLENKSREID